jgi:tripartite-type tricarboxylate transporter receptor subunit TctC
MKALLLVVALAGPALADSYPSRPIRLLVPFAPGGGADTLARIITPRLTEAMGQQWVVDNRAGAAGNIAAETVARAAPDGHTVFMGFSSVLTVNPSLYKLPFSVERDFQPVTELAGAQYLLVLHPSVPASSVKELIALAKQKPRSLNFASAAVGSPLHLAAELFQKRAGIQMVHVPYKGGGPAAAAVLAGEAQVLFGSVASSLPHVKAGRLKALATTGLTRSKVAPDLPTMAESGFPGFDVTTWYALLVPAGTPAEVVKRIHDETSKVLARPDVLQVMATQGLDAETSTPQALAARIRTETKTWTELIRSAGIRAE